VCYSGEVQKRKFASMNLENLKMDDVLLSKCIFNNTKKQIKDNTINKPEE